MKNRFTLKCALCVAFAFCFMPALAQDAITLTETTETGAGIITRYSYNNTSGVMDAINYAVNLAETSFGGGAHSSVFNADIVGKTTPLTISYDTVYGAGENSKTYTLNVLGEDVHFMAKYGTPTVSNQSYEYEEVETRTFSNGSISGIPLKYWANEIPVQNISGAILSNAEDETISITDEVFVNNKVTTAVEHKDAHISGGAVGNAGTIETIKADFIENTISASNLSSGGGAIGNYGVINSIEGTFLGNKSESTYVPRGYYSGGGAIYNTKYKYDKAGQYDNNENDGRIDSINGIFINNYAKGDGGAILNKAGYIENITGDFIGNIADNNGGAIANNCAWVHEPGVYFDVPFGYGIANVSGNFIANKTVGSGGAIFTDSMGINSIKGLFVNNSAEIEGGAIYLLGTGNNYGYNYDILMDGDFISNSANSRGGAIYLSDVGFDNQVIVLKGNFINNSAGEGGAIYASPYFYNIAKEATISANFIGNAASTSGGALFNNQLFYNIISTKFLNNYILNSTENVAGGAIYFVSGYLGSSASVINADFVNNYVSTESGNAKGGAIYANWGTGTFPTIKNSSFINNSATSKSGTAHGGAIYSEYDVTITADNGISEFSGNYVENDGVKDYQGIYLNFQDNDARYLNLNALNNGTVIMNDKISGVATGDTIDIITRDWSSEPYPANPDYYYICKSTIDYIDKNTNKVLFTYYYEYLQEKYDDYSYDHTYYYYYDKDGNKVVIPENEAIVISTDNYGNSEIQQIRDAAAEYLKPYTYTAYTLNIDGDSTGTVYLNNDVTAEKVSADADNAVDIQLSNVTLHLANRDNVIDNNKLTLNSGTFNMINNSAGVSALNTFTVKGDTDMYVDVDLVNKEMDRVEADTHGTHTGTLNVAGMNLVTDATDDFTAVYFAQPELKNNVTNGLGEVADVNSQKTFYSPIYKYTVTYDKENQYDGKGDGGYFLFSRGSGGGSSEAYNPSVLSSPVATQAAGHSAMNETFRYVFEHADAFTQLPAMDRFAKINSNRYAAASTDFNQNIEWNTELHNQGVWVRPYTTFEKIDLKNGPTVDAVTYGTLAGYDSDFRHLKNGWTNVGTGYLGYMGSQLNYNGVDTSMNGGLIGLTETFYKGNFWTALTATAGAGVAESHTMYGKEDSTMLLAGLGSKTGYNFEFKEGKFILQPIMFLSYTFVNTFDYTNAAGVRIKNDPMHTIQINPSVRFITNLKNGWQPYASVGMVWNLLNESTATANNIELPKMSTKPYVEYGVGLQRLWGDKFTAFGQAMLRQGGRSGIALTVGFRWALGVDDKTSSEKPKVKKVLKSQHEKLSKN